MRHKFLLIVVIVMFLTSGCSLQKEQNISILEQNEDQEEIAFLELHFSNGEIYKQKIVFLCFPETYDSSVGGSSYEVCNGNYDMYNFDDRLNLNLYRLHNAFASINDEFIYSFSEAYKIFYDKDSITFTLYLMRDEPYEIEKEFFLKIN